MNVLFIGFDIEAVGGIATYSRYQIRALRELGHRVRVISLDMRESPKMPGVVDRNVRFGNKYLAVLRVLPVLAAELGRHDAVILNHVFLGWFGLLFRWLGRARYAINVYNIDILTRLPALREFAFARADLTIADCRYTIDRLPRFHRRVPPAGLLYDPVDMGFFRPIAKPEARRTIAERFGLGDLAQRFVIVTVAALLLPPNKGHRQTIDALARLRDPRFLYLIAGSGPDRAAIQAYAIEKGVADQVKLLGYVDQALLPALYSAADAALLVARGGDGQGEAVPLGLIEASACATLFICGNEDGSVEAIDDKPPNGIAIGPEDVPALAAALRQLADDPARARAMGEAGQRVVDKVFRFERFVEILGGHLERHLGARSAAAPSAAARKALS
jgi:glycosyltransferase involved in cell wall biosynthesis